MKIKFCDNIYIIYFKTIENNFLLLLINFIWFQLNNTIFEYIVVDQIDISLKFHEKIVCK